MDAREEPCSRLDMRRLYVGGLSHSVNERELKERFGKFGEVHDVELRTRKDDDGVPYKTFGYININISDGDLKRCMTVLNKSKWKGGTLQIEAAKESFLHKLAQERQNERETSFHKPEVEDKRQEMLDALKNAGVENFTMKAAVPGTEVPGHKDWIVSKYGRVLPILQLKSKKGNRVRTLKYDPSKYCHNIRKLDTASVDSPTPVSDLTWEVQGGDDDISKKRRGEFPPYVPPKPKKKAKVIPVITEKHSSTNGFKPETYHMPPQQRIEDWLDSDSEQDIRRIIESQATTNGGIMTDREDQLEVVGLDYFANSKGKHFLHGAMPVEEADYDSADTDELIASKKPPPPKQKPVQPTAEEQGSKAVQKRKAQKRSPSEEEEELKEEPTIVNKSRRKASTDQMSGGFSKQSLENQVVSRENRCSTTPLVANFSAESESDVDEEESDSSVSDSDYEAMFSNVTHLEISMADLQRLAEESQQAVETSVPSSLDTSSRTPTTEPRKPKKGTTPEDILASLLADCSDDEKVKTKKKKKKKGLTPKPPPAFLGTKMIDEASGDEKIQGEDEAVSKQQKQHCEAKQEPNKTFKSSKDKLEMAESAEGKNSETEDDSEEEEKKLVEDKRVSTMLKISITSKSVQNKTRASSDDEERQGEGVKRIDKQADKSKVIAPSSGQVSSLGTITSNKSEDSSNHSESSSSTHDDAKEEEKIKQLHIKHRTQLAAGEEKELQRKANLRRLAAVQQRQKEAEEHKKLIQGALANMDTPPTRAGKHIVFDSDDDEEDKVTISKKTLLQERRSEDEDDVTEAKTSKSAEGNKHSGPRLFGSSDDEEDDDDDDKEDKRFDIRPQFEGPAGQKLMELQSRFGMDERFRMDERFLEEEHDKKDEPNKEANVNGDAEILEDEKKKNLSILQSVLGRSIDPTCSSKPASKAKTFRDVAALHYDPSREEHAAFEAKQEERKESKAERMKKREEAQKLPDVSKDIYFDVSGDLKSVFGFGKNEEVIANEKTNWDQQEDASGKEDEAVADESAEMKESGFKFSFFDDEETKSAEPVEYKVENISVAKVSLLQDPQLQDSSSDEEEEEEDDQEEVISATATEAEAPVTKARFFFYPDDARLTEGPRWFCRPPQLEEKRKEWEEKRSTLRQEYRKKHKDAKRQLKNTKRC
ncbi:nucleolar protein 8 isoform X2 [Synchiropus splendidus]|uniref:nucleolar protein 8 isoform X2 n=1 Tax=Synchiropus splendidus TaxID=270530 RepID=UPI00237D958F|nr:nucleolar protein 8 isoform X2 [Synchiropus splendidus]